MKLDIYYNMNQFVSWAPQEKCKKRPQEISYLYSGRVDLFEAYL